MNYVLPALEDRERNPAELNRLVGVANTLLELRSEPGFIELCRRMKDRDLRAAYYEAVAAMTFAKSGYAIIAKPETGKKGMDFDFSAVRGDETINVEVTTLTAERYSRNTVLNALNAKRKQLPKGAPAVIFCALPERWFEEDADWNFRMLTIVFDFLRQTSRISAVVLLVEFHFEAGERAGFVHVGQPYFNVAPAEPLRDPSVFTSAPEARLTAARLEDIEDSELVRWIKAIFPEWASLDGAGKMGTPQLLLHLPRGRSGQ